ncbi:MAG: DUF1385 domain-containing protein [Acidobacteriota bacterium]
MLVGGQAVIEGVLMRLPNSYAVAVRDPKGEMRVKRERLPETAKGKLGNLPFIRGGVILFKAMMLGMSALNFSAKVSMEDEEDGEAGEEEKSSWALTLTVIASLAIGVAVFFYVPLLAAQLLTKYFHLATNSLGFNLIDGVIRLVLFVGYIGGISIMKDIRRVFSYHGAEHKVVHTYERKEPLTVESARKHSTLHPRCGTSFLLFVMVVAILVFSVVPSSYPFWVKAASRIVFLPVIAGLAYELIRFTARFPKSPFVKPLLWPGLALQKLTTRQPDDSMLAVSLRALEEAEAALEEDTAVVA